MDVCGLLLLSIYLSKTNPGNLYASVEPSDRNVVQILIFHTYDLKFSRHLTSDITTEWRIKKEHEHIEYNVTKYQLFSYQFINVFLYQFIHK